MKSSTDSVKWQLAVTPHEIIIHLIM